MLQFYSGSRASRHSMRLARELPILAPPPWT